jgi:DNA helicase HerA-like ATPase
MTMQNFDHASCKILVTGTSGTGKTTLAQKLLKSEKAFVKFIYDHQGEFSQRFKVPAIRDADELVEKTARGGYVCFDPIDSFPGKAATGFDFFCEFIFNVSQNLNGRKILFCDEIQKLTDTANEPEAFLTLCETGRRFQVDIIAITQAPNRIHNTVRNQLTQVYTFRQSDKNALKYLEDNGFDPEKVRSLSAEKHEWLGRNLDTGEVTASSPALLSDTPRTASAGDPGQRRDVESDSGKA